MASDVQPRETEEGLERLRAVVRANPRSTAFVALAHALCDAGLDEEAEEVARQGLARHPHLVTGQVALGRALLARGRVREAQEQLVDAAKSSPENGDAFRWLGEVVLRRGQRDRARVLLEYAEELNPSDARVSELLAEAGGTPQPRAVRPKSDFEPTRVSNARALAERMHEEPPPNRLPTPAKGKNGSRASDEAVTAEFEPRPSKEQGRPEAAPPPLPPARGSAAKGKEAPPLSARLRALWEQGGRPLRFGAAVLVAVLLAGAAWLLRPARPPGAPAEEATPGKPVVAAIDMTAAIATGTLQSLTTVRALGKRLAETTPADPDQLATAAFGSALLANDYGAVGNADAVELGGIAAKATPPRPFRTGLIEAGRALATLANGRLADAQAAAKAAVAAAPESAEVRLTEGRLALRVGALAEAEAALGKAITRTPVLTTAVLDLAAVKIDQGDGAAAAKLLTDLLARHDDLRARLLLAEAERQTGASVTPNKAMRDRCRDEGKDSAMLRTWCAADAAVAARLAGDRSGAIRHARAATAGAGRNPRALATGALVLGNLGEVEAAAEALRKIRDDSGPKYVPRAFAQLAAALGRGEVPDANVAVPAPNGPDARLVAARLAFARGGKEALADFVARLDAAHLAADPDLAAFAVLAGGDDGPLDNGKRAALEERADKAGGMAAYVLGRRALARRELKVAGQRLYRALTTSAEACAAARLLASIDRKQRPGAVATEAKLNALVRAHGGCSR